jgi:hypothetical protein
MAIQTPTVGRKLWYRPEGDASMAFIGDQPLDATVVAVHNDHCVNLVIFDASGVKHVRTSTYLKQDGVDLPEWVRSYAEWMPYQVKQHQKHADEAAAVPKD